MDEIHWLGEQTELDDQLAKFEAAIPLAVKLQRENGDTNGALNALTPIINQAICMDTPKNSRASCSRAYVLSGAALEANEIGRRPCQKHIGGRFAAAE